jgi:hypothetical protein
MKKYLIAIITSILFGACTKESIVQGITIAPDKSITNEISVNGVIYKIFNAYKSTYIPATCTGRGLAGGFVINGAKEGTTDTAFILILDLPNFNSTQQIYPYGNTSCNVNAFLGLWRGAGDAIYYDSNTTGEFIIEAAKFKLNNTQFEFGNTTLTVNASGNY